MTELHKLTLRELVAGMRDKRWTAARVMDATISCIEARDPEVQAWEYLDVDGAMRAAERLDRRAGEGGPLHGAPIAVKDIIDVSGMPTRFGSPIFASAPPAAASAECVQALEHAGAIVLGKSVTTEFAYYTPRKTRNPWNPKHTPGGSSMGSAAATACGMAAGAIGTQTNGSVIRPAAFCGIVGFKPSFGTVSNHGTLDPWPSLDHTGVFARHVADAALLASVIATPGRIHAAVALPSHGPKLALVRSPVWHLAEPAQKEMVEAAAAKLGHAGAHVQEKELPSEFDDAHRVHRVILAWEAARHFHDVQQHHRDLISPRMNDLIDEGTTTSEHDYRSALDAAVALKRAYASHVQPYDAVITPPTAGEAPATLQETGNPAFCTIWTLLGVPAITIPVGTGPAGLPLGLQIVGARDADDDLLAVAAWCEAHIPFHGLPDAK
jgi:Asp-tRNA(Asn)/Glu-tRNA(Gln) amidotransferase A subunit family amidase